MSTRVDLRSMIHNQIVQQILNPSGAHHTCVPQKTKGTLEIGNERKKSTRSFVPAHEYLHVIRSLNRYKQLTYALSIGLLIMTLATSALWVWAIGLYGQLTFL